MTTLHTGATRRSNSRVMQPQLALVAVLLLTAMHMPLPGLCTHSLSRSSR